MLLSFLGTCKQVPARQLSGTSGWLRTAGFHYNSSTFHNSENNSGKSVDGEMGGRYHSSIGPHDTNTKDTTMTTKQIENAQKKNNVKYELARQIRELLDAAKKSYGAADWETDDIETEIDELVFGDE